MTDYQGQSYLSGYEAGSAAEADKWATGICSMHRRPDSACRLCNINLALHDLVEEHRALERAATVAQIVAWLRKAADQNVHMAAELRWAAERIERGDWKKP